MKVKAKQGARSKNMDKLIAAVQARECLWDKSYRGHRNRFKLERYWNEVAAEVGTTSLNCRKRWKNLKDQCRKEMRKNPSGSDWPHFQKLQFIHNQFLADEEEGDEDTADEVFNSLDDSIKRPKLGYTMRKKLLMNKRRTIDVDMNKLIVLVQAKELIWNRQLKGHHNWYKLDESWKEISQELGVTRDEARLKWKYLRDQARKEARKGQSDWEYLPKLQFLINQFNDYEGNDTAEDHYSQDFDTSADQSSSYYVEPTPDPTEVNDVSVNVKEDEFDEFDTKPVIMETDFCDDDDDFQRSAGNSNEVPETMKDEDIGFFNSLIPHVRKLGPAKKLMLRMKIQELVYNTVYNELR
ncbi:transcription factor Adf-1-like [Maniola hyperantus]|uniref:transcription factor Adf-1-like n=1 Tax=Aphantopus hyperantus TaxID=2795564 RepID=UPI00156A1C6E|nr:transcription factor Adf-1-like [Maniola hyperantus]